MLLDHQQSVKYKSTTTNTSWPAYTSVTGIEAYSTGLTTSTQLSKQAEEDKVPPLFTDILSVLALSDYIEEKMKYR